MKYGLILSRVFSKERYADDFISKGRFRLNTVNFFKNYIDEYENNIGDENEGLIFKYLKEHGASLNLKYGDSTLENIDYESLSAHSAAVLNHKIFCMYSPSAQSDREFAISELHDLIAIQEDAEKLGGFMVIIKKPEVFFRRVEDQLKKLGYGCKSGFIKYVDFNQPIQIEPKMIGFTKSLEFHHQEEFRLMVDDGKNLDEHLDLEVGSLEDIAFMIATKEFNSCLKVISKLDYEVGNY